jgi:hypothetical protein
MIKGFEAGSRFGSVLVTNGSGCGSGRPKNIRNRIGIRIHNTGLHIIIIEREIQSPNPSSAVSVHIQKSFCLLTLAKISCNYVSSLIWDPEKKLLTDPGVKKNHLIRIRYTALADLAPAGSGQTSIDNILQKNFKKNFISCTFFDSSSLSQLNPDPRHNF